MNVTERSVWIGSAAAVWVLAACSLAGCDGALPEGDAGAPLDAGAALDAGPIEPSLIVVDQTLFLSTVVTIPGADFDGPAWLVVTEEGGAVLGKRSLPRGRHTDVEVGLERRVAAFEVLRVALHADAGVIGAFEPAEDERVVAGGVAQEAAFVVRVEEGTPDVRISILNIGDSAYVFTVAHSSAFAITPDPAAENPPIELRRGWRYEVFNPANVSHPFELIRAGETTDEVHLSQRAEGTLHADLSVAFEIVSPAFFRFTVSPSLEAAVDAYRCLIHPHMRGEVSFADEP